MKKTPKILNGWLLGEPLGKGGNGTVYAATKNGADAAIKILSERNWKKSQRLARFRDEISAMRKCKHIAGVLTILDSDVPKVPSVGQPPWYAMTRAESSLDKSFENEIDLDLVVRAIRDISLVLAAMHAIDVSHRDIKPSNLFRFNGLYGVGDFGLAHFSDRLARTVAGEKIGAMYYIAPEMLNEAITADGKSADVYSLAKTLWVLGARQKYPTPGHQVASFPALTLSAYSSHPLAAKLDRLIEGCTSPDPDARVTMQQFHLELDAWLRPATTGAATPSHLDLSEFSKQLESNKLKSDAKRQAELARREFVASTSRRLREYFRPLAADLKTALTTAHFECPSAPVDWGFGLWATIAREPNEDLVMGQTVLGVSLYVNVEVKSTGIVEIRARQAIRVHNGSSWPLDDVTWEQVDSFIAGGSEEAAKMGQVEESMRRELRATVLTAVQRRFAS